ncbi:hypothetical protein BU204_25380 [Actinophytocola xanthii]|uniref:Uncharacterized protein n=2 Tax=Actinophytocola xanthii TaxID=1912961 RepID=A0A1Q8CK60_9PSEU|nr:hypothetical protein BU204_25380 [Actinophytocola xanthii]
MAFLLALAGTVFVAGTASAAKSRQALDTASVTQACEISACAKDVQSIPANAAVDTYCSHPGGGFNLTYTNPTFGRGGYIPVTNFANNTRNPEQCGAFSGSFARTRVATNLWSCSGGGCVNFGNVLQRGEQLRAFCHLPPGQPNSLLVYVPRNTFAGFVRTSELDINPSVPSCNQGF